MNSNGKKCVCKICGKEYIYIRSKGHRLNMCNSCSSNDRRFKRKQKAVQYKGGKCEIFGYDRCLESLTFHHTNPGEKEFAISGNHCLRWDLIEKELDKCVLVCRNCHGEIESKTLC